MMDFLPADCQMHANLLDEIEFFDNIDRGNIYSIVATVKRIYALSFKVVSKRIEFDHGLHEWLTEFLQHQAMMAYAMKNLRETARHMRGGAP